MNADRILALLVIGCSIGFWLGVKLAEANDNLHRDIEDIETRRQP